LQALSATLAKTISKLDLIRTFIINAPPASERDFTGASCTSQYVVSTRQGGSQTGKVARRRPHAGNFTVDL
jgi:hypothetical protein